MIDTSWTESDFSALETAIKSGVRTVSYGERSVTYHSLDEMLRLRAEMKAAVEVASGSANARYSVAQFTRA